MAQSIRIINAKDWEVRKAPPGKKRRSAAAGETEEFPSRFLAPSVRVSEVVEATPTDARRGSGATTLDLAVETRTDESTLVALRHPSGALTFHAPGEAEARHRSAPRRAAANIDRFRIELRRPPVAPARRGLVSAALKVIVLKVAGRVADAVLPALVRRFEETLWRKRGLKEGFVRVDRDSLRRRLPLRP